MKTIRKILSSYHQKVTQFCALKLLPEDLKKVDAQAEKEIKDHIKTDYIHKDRLSKKKIKTIIQDIYIDGLILCENPLELALEELENAFERFEVKIATELSKQLQKKEE